MARVLVLFDGAPVDEGGPPELLPLAHAVVRGASATGCTADLLGLAADGAAAEALARADVRALPSDEAELAALVAAADAVVLGGAAALGTLAGSVAAALGRLAALPPADSGAGPLSGKVGAAFACIAAAAPAPLGGHETALASVHTQMLHCGMLVAGAAAVPGAELAALSAGSPLGVCMSPGEKDQACRAAERQGQHIADIAARLQLAGVVSRLRS